jgi:hypothetical protein
VKDNNISLDRREHRLSNCIIPEGTSGSTERGSVLVKDTLENKYKIKVTWRRQRHLFAHFKERGS